jgi:prevent-host-death family protein
MKRMSVHEAKAHFSALLKEVASGETIVITKHDQPIAEINPVGTKKPKRRLGLFAGEMDIPDEAFAPLTDEELKDWYGE